MAEIGKNGAPNHAAVGLLRSRRRRSGYLSPWAYPDDLYSALKWLLLVVAGILLYAIKPEIEMPRITQAVWGFSLTLFACSLTRTTYPLTRLVLSPLPSLGVAAVITLTLVWAIDAKLVSILSGVFGVLLGVRHEISQKPFLRSRMHLALVLGVLVINSTYLINLADEVVEEVAPRHLYTAQYSTQLGRLDASRASISRATVPDFYGGNVDVLKVTLAPALDYSGFRLVHFNQDWSQYSTLQIRLYNPPQRPLPVLGLRINDKVHYARGAEFGDRFDKILKLERGWNAFEFSINDIMYVPSGRVMRANAIANVELFAAEPNPGDVFYVEGMWLD